MPLPPRALALVLALAVVPQAPRTALGRCTITRTPAAVFKLPDTLEEVSGLAVGPGGTLLTHGDERGQVMVLDAATARVLHEVDLEGTPRDDFEGIATSGDSVALMTSSGRLYFFRLGTGTTSPVRFSVVETGLGRYCELEGLAWDRKTATLLLPCKEPTVKAVLGLTVFRYRLGRAPGTLPPIVVSGGELARVTGLGLVRATSVEVDPATGHLIVLSSKPPMLIEIDTTGHVAMVRHLPGKHHPQAEGVTLGADALWVADEGAGRKGTLARYACR